MKGAAGRLDALLWAGADGVGGWVGGKWGKFGESLGFWRMCVEFCGSFLAPIANTQFFGTEHPV